MGSTASVFDFAYGQRIEINDLTTVAGELPDDGTGIDQQLLFVVYYAAFLSTGKSTTGTGPMASAASPMM